MTNKIDLRNINGFDDLDLSKKLSDNFNKNNKIEIIFQHRTVLVFVEGVFSYKGAFLENSFKVIKKKSPGLFKIKSVTNLIELNFSDIKDIDAFSISGIKNWMANSKERLKLKSATEKTVWLVAKERCQMCGIEVSSHPSTQQQGNYAQIAHIEACGLGKRYNKELENTNEIDNLMLLCYNCHRIIDVINPEKYTVEVLKDIKIKQEAKVKWLLNTLKNKEVIPIRISTRLYGDDYVYATDSEIIEALNEKNLSVNYNHFLHKNLLSNVLEEKRNPHDQKYWEYFFTSYKKDSIIINDKKTQSAELALFLYHGISEMIFLGSRFGDTVRVHLFQKHRNENIKFNWTWPNNEDLSGYKNLQFFQHILKEPKKHTEKHIEGLLLVTLTADINISNLPINIYNNDYVLPTIQITSNQINKKPTIISKESDLQNVQNLINSALKKMNDEWKLKKIHIIVIAPTVINFSIGQAIQSKYQAEVICYEKNSKSNLQEPTICIKEDIVYVYSNPKILLALNQ